MKIYDASLAGTVTTVSGSTSNLTGSFSGSFVGNGLGLELNKIVDGGTNATISATQGLRVNTDTTVTGSLTVTGNLTAQQFIVSSSVTYLTESFASGSHKFGDSSDDIHTFTGSLVVSGSANPLIVGSNLLFVSSSGNVAINGTPTSFVNNIYFDIIGNTTTQGGILQSRNSDNSIIGSFFTNANGLNIRTETNHAFILSTNNVERMRITAAGNIGIGTSDPQSSLHIIKALGNDVISIGESSNITRLSIGQEASYAGNYINSQNINLKFQSFLAGGTGGNIIFQTGGSGAGSLTERVRITSGGALCINRNDSPYGNFSIKSNGTTPYAGLNIFAPIDNQAFIFMNHDSTIGFIGTDYATGGYTPLSFLTSNTERMRIATNGEILIGTTSAFSSGLLCVRGSSATYNLLAIRDNYTGPFNDVWYALFTNASGVFSGGIQHTASTTVSFVTSSDYRLKEDFKQIKGLETLLKIKTYDFKFKDEDFRMDGVLAHELQEVIPYAVHGVKDGERMQGVDYSKLVPVLIKSVQELKAEIDILKQQ